MNITQWFVVASSLAFFLVVCLYSWLHPITDKSTQKEVDDEMRIW